MDIWQGILCPFLQLGIKEQPLVYDPKLLKNAYRKWLKIHHPDKGSRSSANEVFLKIYSRFFKDLPDVADSVWQTMIEIEEAVRRLEISRTEEDYREIRRAVEPFLDFNLVNDEFPVGYVKAMEECLKYIKSEMLKAATTACKKHDFRPGEIILVSECKRCKEDEGLLTRCFEHHSSLFHPVYKEECKECENVPVQYIDEELPDLDIPIQSEESESVLHKHIDKQEYTESSNSSVIKDKEYIEHVSIVKDNIPSLLLPSDNGNSFSCLLCPSSVVIAQNQKKRHESIHLKFLVAGAFKVLLCKQTCRKKCHYHCPFCGIIHNRRIDAKIHYGKCEAGGVKRCKQKNIKNKRRRNKSKKFNHKKAMFANEDDWYQNMSDDSFPQDQGEKQQGEQEKNCSSTDEDSVSFKNKEFVQTDEEVINNSNKNTEERKISFAADDEENTRNEHESIIKSGHNINLKTFFDDSKNTNCKLCPKGTFIPPNKVLFHTMLHSNHFITVGKIKVLMCKQECREKSHYHCPFCEKTFVRKVDAEQHIKKCRAKKTKKGWKSVKKNQPLQQKKLFHSTSSKTMRKRTKMQCTYCQKEMYTWNLMQHIRNVHTLKTEYTDETNYSESICIDREREIYLVHSGSSGPNIPIHVQRKIVYGRKSEIYCEKVACKKLNNTSHLTNKPDFECRHVRSVLYNKVNGTNISLKTEEPIKRILSSETRAEIKMQKKNAIQQGMPHIIMSEFTGDNRRIHFSVFENNDKHSFSKLKRVRVSYDKNNNLWFCACCHGRSCIHKYTAKWACVIKYPNIFSNAGNVYSQYDNESFESNEDDIDDPEILTNKEIVKTVDKMLEYKLAHKKIPFKVSEAAINKSRTQDFLVEYYPKEEKCTNCSGDLFSELITERAIIITKTGAIRNIKTYQKVCNSCDLKYDYQEFEDGVHNYNNRILLSLELCLHLRSMLCSHTAVSRVIQSIEMEYETSIPYKRDIFDAYLHFENLCDYTYDFSCDICGKYPVKLIGDGNKKTCFDLNVEELPEIPETFDGEVNIHNFWTDISKDLLSRAYIKEHLADTPWHNMPKTRPRNMPLISKQFMERISNFTSLVDSTEMFQFNSYVVKRSSMATLKCDEWLDDQVVNAYMNLLASEHNILNTARKALHLDSFLMTSLIRGSVHTLLKNIYFRDYRYVLIPVHQQNHWCLMIIYIEEEKIAYIDPLNPGFVTDQGVEFIRKIKSFSVNRLTANPLDLNLKEFKIAITEHHKQQDGASCGVWVLMFAEQLLSGNITPKQTHVPYFRWYIAYRLYNAGKRASENDRTICDVKCKIHETHKKTVTWIQCDSYMCANWVHPFCIDLPIEYKGKYICPTCSMKTE